MNLLLAKLQSQDERIFKEQAVLKHQQLPSIVDYHDRQKEVNDRLFRSVEQKINLLDKLGGISSR